MMTMFQMQSEALGSSKQANSVGRDLECDSGFECLDSTQGIVSKTTRSLSNDENAIIKTINNCFQNWYGPWKRAYLHGGDEFDAIYDLMENLMHYEYQIKNSDSILSNDRTYVIVQAVVRLVDYGNAILNLDLIVRADDGTARELDPFNVTTIELYHAHVKAQKLRDKLLCNYFKRDKRNYVTVDNETPNQSSLLSLPLSASRNSLHIGSNTSINTLLAENGRRTSQVIASQIEVKAPAPDNMNIELTSSQNELRDMVSTMKSSAFADFCNIGTRRALLPKILDKIESLMTVRMTIENSNNCFELLDLLISTIEKLPPDSRKDEVLKITYSLLRLIVRKVYCVKIEDHTIEFQHSHWTTYLLSLIRLITPADFSTYLKHFTNLTDLSAFLKDYLFIIKRLVTSDGRQGAANGSPSVEMGTMLHRAESIYPNCWIEMTLLVCSTFLTSLISLYQTLRHNYASNLQMWKNYIDCLVHFMLQDTLRPGRSMYKERQKLLANDLRKTSAEYVWITWDSLTYDQKQSILEDLIEPLLRACMVLDSRQRSILLPIFHDMMRCDYTSQYITPRGSIFNSSSDHVHLNRLESQMNYLNEQDFGYSPNGIHQLRSSDINKIGSKESLPYLSLRESPTNDDGTVLTKFTHLVVGKLNDLIVDSNLGDVQFKEEFCSALSGELNSKYYHNQNSLLGTTDLSQLKRMSGHTSDIIAEFIQITLDYREANKLSYNHLCLLCLFKLILFFRDKVHRIELYLAYLHKLWLLHHNAGRYTEAGFTLLEHAKTLPWSDEQIESHYRIITRSFNLTEPITDYSNLKTFLYTTIIEYFDKGQLWEAAVPLCRELIDIYQFRTYEYVKLAEILAKLSTYFENISNGSLRSHPEYFRVAFYGCGYPKCLQDVTMVYRGKPYEKLGDFQATILNKYPDAKLLNTLGQPNEQLLSEPEAKYLQINACSPVVDLACKFNNNASSIIDLNKLNSSILNYYRHNECDKFEFSRRISRPTQSLAFCSSSHQLSTRLSDASTTTTTSDVGSDGHNSSREPAPPPPPPPPPTPISSGDNFSDIWRERTTLTTNSLPGMLPFFVVYLTETNIVSPIECAIEDLERANDRLSSMVNRFKADKRHHEDVRLLGQLLLGVVDAAVNGGITKYEEAFLSEQQQQAGSNRVASSSSFTLADHRNIASKQQQQDDTERKRQSFSMRLHNRECGSQLVSLAAPAPKQSGQYQQQRQHLILVDRCHGSATTRLSPPPPSQVYDVTPTTIDYVNGRGREQMPPVQHNTTQVNKLKCLIAEQVPLLDEAIRLHRDRVADVMRPQHEHLETSYKRLKHHIMSKYSRFLPLEYSRASHSANSTLIRSYQQRHLRARSPAALSATGSSSIRSSTASNGSCSRTPIVPCDSGPPSPGLAVDLKFLAPPPPPVARSPMVSGSGLADDSSASIYSSCPTFSLQAEANSLEVDQSQQQQHKSPPPLIARSKRASDASCRSSDIPYQQLTDLRSSPPIVLTGDPSFDCALIREQSKSRSRRPARVSAGARLAPTHYDNHSNEIYYLSDTPQAQPPQLPPRSCLNPSNSSSANESQAYVCLSDLMAGVGLANISPPVGQIRIDHQAPRYAPILPDQTSMINSNSTLEIAKSNNDDNELVSI